MPHDDAYFVEAMEVKERTFYDDPEICVTCRRVIVGGRTIPMQEVESVEQRIEQAPSIGWPLVFMILGVAGMLITLRRGEPGDAFLLLVGTTLAAAWMAANRVSYTISIVGPRGSAPVVHSRDEGYSRAVFVAISSAISSRHTDRAMHD